MEMNFERIRGPKGSGADNFALLCTRLISADCPEARHVEGRGEDEGLDTYIGEINNELRVFQFKYFCDRIRKNQKAQIKRSLETALKHHRLLSWTLVLPTDMNMGEQRWFQEVSKKYPRIQMAWWGETRLRNLLSVHPDIAKDFFEPYDAAALRHMLIRQDKIAFILRRIRSDLSQLNELVKATRPVVQISPNQPSETHERFLALTFQDLVQRSRLSVLVWGPSAQTNRELFTKRVQIRDKLRDLGHRADFSEDILEPHALAAGGLNLSPVELLQAKGYEYIICIMGSPGSIGEVHDFCHSAEIAHKTTVCINEQHISGYSGMGILRIFEGNHGHLERFRFPEDVVSCSLRDRVVDQVEKCAAAKQDQIARIAGA